MSELAELVLVAGAALAGGMVNAIAGGGSLITFPALVAVGLSPAVASLTNTVALCPGYLGATFAQRKDLAGQRARMLRILPVSAIGGIAGALLLLFTDERAFEIVVPFLILFAAVLLAVQDTLRGWLVAKAPSQRALGFAVPPIALAAVYGGYFGAGMGVIILAALGVVLVDTLTRINALKQTVSLTVNVAAAGVFVFSGRVDWPIAGIMLAAALGGGFVGGAIASRIPATLLRWVVVVLATAIAIIYFARW